MTPRTLVFVLVAALLALLIALLLSVPSAAQMCKWTDEDGTVHYAERCPEGIDGEALAIDEGPGDDLVEAARQRSRELAESREARQAERSLAVDEEKFLETGDGMDRAIQCVTALRDVRILRIQLPVFYDENGRLHYNRSRFDTSYQGPRRYVSDKDRPSVMAEAQRRADEYCGDSEEELARQRVAAAALLDADLCRDWQARARSLERSREPGSREMARWLEERCR